MKKNNLVIVGAGLGGCILADSLAENWNVTIVETGSALPLLQDRVKDTDIPAVTYPLICSGLGGTTLLWHNGLIEIDKNIFKTRWPFSKLDLDKYYEKAFFMLSGQQRSVIIEKAGTLLQKYIQAGFNKECFGEWLYYPKNRINPWFKFKLKGRIRLIEGEVIDIKVDGNNNIDHLSVIKNGQEQLVKGDVYVFAAGGLGSPVLLNNLNKKAEVSGLQNVGFHYEDHPMALIGELILTEPLFRLWNYPCANGNLRLPLFVEVDGLRISFQLRPSANSLIMNPTKRVKSVISELRNNLFNPRLYLRLITHLDDIMEILSFKFNINFPTCHYTLLMVAEQPPSKYCAVWKDDDHFVHRKWIIDDNLFELYDQAIKKVLSHLQNKIKSVDIYDNWKSNINSASHHSGAARMAANNETGVCDLNNQVFGFDNLYVCDGSVIPATGIANSGLTIAALALRLADHLNDKYHNR